MLAMRSRIITRLLTGRAKACSMKRNRELQEGEACLIEAHNAQTQMLSEEARGEELPFSLMLVHGQDHLMTTIMFGRMAQELIEVYKELRAK